LDSIHSPVGWKALFPPSDGAPFSIIHKPRMQETGVHIIPWPKEMLSTHQRASLQFWDFFFRGKKEDAEHPNCKI